MKILSMPVIRIWKCSLWHFKWRYCDKNCKEELIRFSSYFADDHFYPFH